MTRTTDVPRPERLFSRGTVLAGAALALPLAANASVIASGPVNITKTSSDATNSIYDLDLNSDGSSDFEFVASFTDTSVKVTPFGLNGYIGVTFLSDKATPLTAGSPIDSSRMFLTGTTHSGFIQKSKIKKSGEVKQKGPWPTDGSSAYLGVEFFDAANALHYGWVQLSATTPNAPAPTPLGAADSAVATFTIDQYAYQSDPNVGILAGQTTDAPEPSSLALFAAGAAGLLALRARRKRNV